MRTNTYRIIIAADTNGTFHGYVPALPGCHTWGGSLSAVRQKLREAIILYLEDLIADKEPIPSDESLETFETVQLPDAPGLQYA